MQKCQKCHNPATLHITEVLAENHLMLQVIADGGWPCTRHLDGSVLHVEIDLDATRT